jgi:hypothetical protein
MSIKALKAGIFGVAMLLGAAAADATTLTPNGTVLINKGNGFVQVTGPIEVVPGDMVMVNEGTAQMTFPDGSVASMQPGQVYTVGSAGGAGAGAGVAAGAGAGAGGLSATTLIVGGVVVAGGAAAAIAASNSGKKSSSP